MITEPFPPQLDEILETFEDLEDWEERYDFIIEMGRKLPEIEAQHQSKQNIVEGCMSTVWLITRHNPADPERIEIIADSDSIIVKGLIVILLAALSDKTAEEIVSYNVEDLFTKLGLNQHLSPNRRNGLFSMVKRIRQLAVEQSAA